MRREMTSYWRGCDVMTSQRPQLDVMLDVMCLLGVCFDSSYRVDPSTSGYLYRRKSEYLSIPEILWRHCPEGTEFHWLSGMDRYEDDPSGHMMSELRHTDVYATSSRHTDVNITSLRRHLSAGLFFCSKCTSTINWEVIVFNKDKLP